MLQRDTIIVNSMLSSVMNNANLKTTVPGGKDGTKILFKAPPYLGHVGELHYVSLEPNSNQPSISGNEIDNGVLNSAAAATELLQLDASQAVVNSSILTDFGYVVNNRSRLTDAERLYFINTPWTPPADFSWPFTERMNSGKVRKKFLGIQHVTGVNNVFAYLSVKGGLFCRICVLFAADCAGGVGLSRLIREPLQKYAHVTGRDGYLTNHLQTKSHEECMQKAADFRVLMSSSSGDI